MILIPRFSAENKAKMNPYQFMPFGYGPRLCLGKRLALTEIKVAMTKMLREFEIKTCSETQVRTLIHICTFKEKNEFYKFISNRRIISLITALSFDGSILRYTVCFFLRVFKFTVITFRISNLFSA
jgi:hypothetical protein